MSRSSRLKPSPFERWVRTTSPSSSVTWRPASSSKIDSTAAVVDLPEPLSPVNQRQIPCLCRGGYASAMISATSGRVNQAGSSRPLPR